MSSRGRAGFTLIEVMIAVVLLTVGVMALASGSASVSRMIGRGRTDTMVADVVSSRADVLRRIAASTNPQCTALAKGDTTAGGIQQEWSITSVGTFSRTVQLIVSYRTAKRAHVDTTTITLYCD